LEVGAEIDAIVHETVPQCAVSLADARVIGCVGKCSTKVDEDLLHCLRAGGFLPESLRPEVRSNGGEGVQNLEQGRCTPCSVPLVHHLAENEGQDFRGQIRNQVEELPPRLLSRMVRLELLEKPDAPAGRRRAAELQENPRGKHGLGLSL
jgi:hypothetical protein